MNSGLYTLGDEGFVLEIDQSNVCHFACPGCGAPPYACTCVGEEMR